MYRKDMQNLCRKKSIIRELFEYGKIKKQELGNDNVYDFSIGNPSVPSPKIVTDTLKKLIDEIPATTLHGYTSAAGDLEVRKSIADYLNKKYQTNIDPKKIYLTVGAAAALTITFNAILYPNDEVIVFAPYFPEYRVFIEKAGGVIVVIKSLENTFLPDFNKLEKTINEKTKIILINSPNNPTGVLLNEQIIEKITNLMKKKEKEYGHPIYLVSDEPYRELIYNKEKYPFITNYYDNSIICYSFSKSLSLPGERIGYVLVGTNCIDSNGVYEAICGSGRALGFVCAPTLFQYLIPYCLEYTSDINIYKENRDYLYNELIKIGYTAIKPDGAFYLFVKTLENSSEKFSKYAMDKYNLLIVPSVSFGYEGYVRISYCVDKRTIIRSINVFAKLYNDYKGANNE